MSKKVKTEFEWLFGRKVDFFGYRKSGVWGMYCAQVRHHWFGIYGLIGFRYTQRWGSDW